MQAQPSQRTTYQGSHAAFSVDESYEGMVIKALEWDAFTKEDVCLGQN